MPASSSIYWNSEESQRSSLDDSEPRSSSSSASSGRRYVDPWDLENYAYLRRRQIEIKLPRNDHDDEAAGAGAGGKNLNNHHQNINNDSQYWYPMMPVIREVSSGQDNDSSAAPSVEDLYIGSSRKSESKPQSNFYHLQQAASYSQDEARYVTPNPVYVPLSDIEYQESEQSSEQVFPKILPRRRNRVIKSLTKHLEECPCPFHGPLPADVALSKESSGRTPSKPLGLNTYGHLRIDYAKSWNSLHRKMKN